MKTKGDMPMNSDLTVLTLVTETEIGHKVHHI